MEIVFFLFGMLAVVPTIVLAMQGRRTYTMTVYHYHHQGSTELAERQRPQTPQEPVQQRYQVITGSSSAYVLDTHSGERYAIVQPYKAVIDEQ
jgi:hypothetical protein